jgi:hypothetical protein
MRRTIEIRRGDVMHYRWPECKAADPLKAGFFGARPIALRRGLKLRPAVFATVGGFAIEAAERRRLERVKGIEPSSSAWKAVALPLSYTRDHYRLAFVLVHLRRRIH